MNEAERSASAAARSAVRCKPLLSGIFDSCPSCFDVDIARCQCLTCEDEPVCFFVITKRIFRIHRYFAAEQSDLATATGSRTTGIVNLDAAVAGTVQD